MSLFSNLNKILLRYFDPMQSIFNGNCRGELTDISATKTKTLGSGPYLVHLHKQHDEYVWRDKYLCDCRSS